MVDDWLQIKCTCGDPLSPNTIHRTEGPCIINDELRQCVYEFFTEYLNLVEESESGRMFNPITIGCCRATMFKPLDKLLDRMRELSGAEPNPLYKDSDRA
jgi:hypothetical protein